MLVLVGSAAVGCLVGGCAAGDGEADGDAAVSGGMGAAQTTAGAGSGSAGDVATGADAGPEGDAADTDAMSDEEARSALAEAGLAADAANGEDTAGSAGRSAAESAGESAGTAPGADAAGQALFDDICSVCHGDDGTGRIGLDLTISTLAPDEVREVLLYGRPETQMAGFAEILTEAEIDSLVAFVASLRQRG